MNSAKEAEQRMFDWLEHLVFGPAAKLAWKGKPVPERYMAKALTEYFGISFAQARSVRNRWLHQRNRQKDGQR